MPPPGRARAFSSARGIGVSGFSGRGRAGGGSATSSPMPLSRRLQEWSLELTIAAIFVCAAVAGICTIHLSLQRQQQQQPAWRTAAAPAFGRKAGGQPLGGSSSPVPSAPQAPSHSAALHQVEAEPPRLSIQAERLSDEELHGGWQLSQEVRRRCAARARPAPAPRAPLQLLWPAACLLPFRALRPRPLQVFDRATRHPNATVLSWSAPRLLVVGNFLTPAEIDHLEWQASGGCAGGGCMGLRRRHPEAAAGDTMGAAMWAGLARSAAGGIHAAARGASRTRR